MSQPQEHNFCFPIRELANDKVKLTPFLTRHTAPLIAQTGHLPQLWAHMPAGPFPTEASFDSNFLEKVSLPNPNFFTFAVIDKTKPPSSDDPEGELAGMMSLTSTSTIHLSTEIGYVLVFPAFHRTHVTTNAVGLMLQFALGGTLQGGLGLRRVQWQTSTMNAASIRTAERLGFRREAVLRWHIVFKDGVRNHKAGNGRALPAGSDEGDLGRDTVVLSLCWNDWEEGGREKVEEAMTRTK